jgi:hypothetical protein
VARFCWIYWFSLKALLVKFQLKNREKKSSPLLLYRIESTSMSMVMNAILSAIRRDRWPTIPYLLLSLQFQSYISIASFLEI